MPSIKITGEMGTLKFKSSIGTLRFYRRLVSWKNIAIEFILLNFVFLDQYGR